MIKNVKNFLVDGVAVPGVTYPALNMEMILQSARVRLRYIQSKLDLEDWNPEQYPMFASKQVRPLLFWEESGFQTSHIAGCLSILTLLSFFSQPNLSNLLRELVALPFGVRC
jgi:hypothetical protein